VVTLSPVKRRGEDSISAKNYNKVSLDIGVRVFSLTYFSDIGKTDVDIGYRQHKE
jgi:hypothetical protein